MAPKLIEDLLKLISMGEALNEAQEKQMEDYKFWKTQPVPKFDDKVDTEGPIDRVKKPLEIPAEPLPLLSDFEWSTIDVDSTSELDEVYELLYEHYVEDHDATFRFKYSHEFFRWALKPPGWKKEWHVGVRVKTLKKLVAFIAAVPVTLQLNTSGNVIPSVEINFLCIHKKLRSKRLAPVLIKEITRRVNREDIWQALYTAGIVLPSPLSSCRYTHRPLNWSKLNDVGFSHLPPDQTKSGMVARYALPSATKIPGLRPFQPEDIDQVFTLFHEYQKRFELVQIFTKEEMTHWLLGGSERASVIKTYVVETEGKITDFFSYYLLPFTVLNNTSHKELGVAYLFYYATESAKEEADVYKKRMNTLITDALITAKQFDVDVFNALTCQDNPLFIKDSKFGAGDGLLNYYLFNYRTKHIDGGIDAESKQINSDGSGSGIGVVLF